MPCDEWRILMEQFYKAEKAYHEAVNCTSGLEGVQFDRACQRAEEARMTRRYSEKVLEDHERAHNCLGQSSGSESKAS
jgi:hypothetical protein